MELPHFLLYAASWVAITGGVWALFERAETVASDEARTAVSRWMKNLDPAGTLATWPETFAAVFDRVFGERHLSWKCFLRSCIASIVAVIIVTLLWAGLRPGEFTAFLQGEEIAFMLFIILLFAGIINLIPDYLSLLESRYVIRWMIDKQSQVPTFAFLAIDFVATGAIGLIAHFVFLVLTPWGFSAAEFFSIFQEHVLPLSASVSGEPAGGIWFYSTFFTSVWVWLYALSGLTVKLAQYLGVGLGFLKRFVNIDDKPLRSLGFVSMLLITLVYLIAPFLS